jgi:hypothetical protein
MSQWGNKEGRQVIWHRTPINRISPICFHLNRLESGKDDSSSEAHPQSSKTSNGSLFLPELNIFVKNFETYFVTPSFQSSQIYVTVA